MKETVFSFYQTIHKTCRKYSGKIKEEDVDKFLTFYPHLTRSFLLKYLVFQFRHYINANDISFRRVASKKARDRFENRDAEDRQKDLNFCKYYNLQDLMLSKTNFSSTFEQTRKIKHNTAEGMVGCMANQVFYEKESKWCQICQFQKICQKVRNITYLKYMNYENRLYRI